jgi:hypothetical protein
MQHTIEAVLQPLTRSEGNTIDLCTREGRVERQAEEIVAKSTDESLPVEQAAKTSPSHLSFQLIEIKPRWVKQRRSRTP